MKTLRLPFLAVVVLTVIIIASHHSTAQTTNSIENRGTPGQYDDLVSYLSKRGDSNAVAQVNDFITATAVERSATDIVIDVHILNDLRSGKTNEAIRLLEAQLDGNLMLFGTPFAFKHDAKYDKILERAKEYRSKYPHKSRSPAVDTAIAHAFDSLPK